MMTNLAIPTRALDVPVVNELDKLEHFREFWDKNNANPNADLDFYKTIITCRSDMGARPLVFVIKEDDTIRCLIAARLEHVRHVFRIGYLRLPGPKIRKLELIHGGMIGTMEEHQATLFANNVSKIMADNKIDMIYADMLHSDSPLRKSLDDCTPSLLRNPFFKQQKHYLLNFPESFEALMGQMKSKHRYWIRRQTRLLEESCPNHRIALLCRSDEIDRLMEDAEKVAAHTYQRALGRGFINNDEMRTRLELQAGRGRLRAYLLYLDTAPACFWIGFRQGTTFHLSSTGYDPQYRKMEIGTVLFYKMVEDLFENGIESVDFGCGEAFYKARLANEEWSEQTWTRYAATAKGRFLSVTDICANFIGINSRKMLEKWGIEQQVKTFMRKAMGRAA
ncbi:MAG: GNAT family N-acetyltransferase [Chitinivibrionales bacterium]|nr:GNAT family N-acetyltransferase [Chitinivibrionales bacterium]